MYWTYIPGTILSYGAITTNKISSLAELITESRSVQVRHGVCQFYPLSLLGNLGTAPGPKSHLTETAAGDSQFGMQVAWWVPQDPAILPQEKEPGTSVER